MINYISTKTLLLAVEGIKQTAEPILLERGLVWDEFLSLSEETLGTNNTEGHREWLGRRLEVNGIKLPDDLEVSVESFLEHRRLVKKHNPDLLSFFPSIEHGAAILTIGDTSYLQINYDYCRFIDNNMFFNLIGHELCHWTQRGDGRLRISANEQCTEWTVPGEEFSVSHLDDNKAKMGFKTTSEYLMYELKKPWEQEAYLSYNYDDVKFNLTKEQREEVRSWIVPSLRHLVANIE